MKITGFELGKLRVPLKTPFKTALRTVDHMEDVVVVLETDTGHRGFGSAPATAVITGETHGSIIEAIRTVILPAIQGEDIQNLNHIVELTSKSMFKNFSAKAAVEVAVYDLFAQSFDAPLYQVLGGGEPVLSTDITISVDYIDKMVQDAVNAVEGGFETLKIKVGKNMDFDKRQIAEMRRAFPAIRLMADSNHAYDLPEAIEPTVQRLAARAASDPDVGRLLDALPPLAQALRYGDVRSTDAGALREVVDGLVVRILAGVVASAHGLDDDGAADQGGHGGHDDQDDETRTLHARSLRVCRRTR